MMVQQAAAAAARDYAAMVERFGEGVLDDVATFRRVYLACPPARRAGLTDIILTWLALPEADAQVAGDVLTALRVRVEARAEAGPAAPAPGL